MYKILCFGDSNTYGFNPENGSRYNKDIRWSGILKKTLKNVQITELGCNNRTCFNNLGMFNSLLELPKHIKDNNIIILQIGINDLQKSYNMSLEKFEEGFEKLISSISEDVKIILLCPNIINKCILNSYFNNLFDKNSIILSEGLYEIYKKVANKYNCDVINLNTYTKTSTIDGLHYDAENHKLIADIIIKHLQNMHLE